MYKRQDLLQLVRRFEDFPIVAETYRDCLEEVMDWPHLEPVSYTHLRAHETVLDLVCRLLLEKKKLKHHHKPAPRY